MPFVISIGIALMILVTTLRLPEPLSSRLPGQLSLIILGATAFLLVSALTATLTVRGPHLHEALLTGLPTVVAVLLPLSCAYRTHRLLRPSPAQG